MEKTAPFYSPLLLQPTLTLPKCLVAPGPCFTCCVQRRSLYRALRVPAARGHIQQVLEDLGMALPAGDVEAIPAILVLQQRVGSMLHESFDHLQVLPGASHH